MLLIVVKLLMFREHNDEGRAHAREVINGKPVVDWYVEPHNLTIGLLAGYVHQVVGGDAHRFSLFALIVDLTMFTVGFIAVFNGKLY